jgi:hypothetical protein
VTTVTEYRLSSGPVTKDQAEWMRKNMHSWIREGDVAYIQGPDKSDLLYIEAQQTLLDTVIGLACNLESRTVTMTEWQIGADRDR